jgi:hypothetical protein
MIFCTVVEIATHPIFACVKSRPRKPDRLPKHAGVCFVCDQHRIAKKHPPAPPLRREGGPGTRMVPGLARGRGHLTRPRPAARRGRSIAFGSAINTSLGQINRTKKTWINGGKSTFGFGAPPLEGGVGGADPAHCSTFDVRGFVLNQGH